jgi:Cytochrome c554 and c-prime
LFRERDAPDPDDVGHHVLALVTVVAVTGYGTYAAGGRLWAQWVVLAHVLGGCILMPFAAYYLVRHLRRIVGVKRLTMSLGGLAATLPLLWVVGTGLHICMFGQREALRWVYESHVAVSAASLALLLLHLILYRAGWPTNKPRPAVSPYAGLWKLVTAYAGATVALVLSAVVAYPFFAIPVVHEPAIRPYQLTYGEHPFRPSQTETSDGGFVDAGSMGNSGRCGACHAQIVEDWRASMHSQASSDKAYQTNVNLLASKRGIATVRYCEGCHAPVALLSGQLTEGGKLDTVGHLEEGVNCLVCHGMERIVHVKGVGSFSFALPRDYLFERDERGLPTKIHNFLVRVQPRQHRLDMARPTLPEPAMCATCHVQFMDKDVNQWGWVQMQDEYTAWLASPYSRQTQQTFSAAGVQRCQDCHFPLVEGVDPSASSDGLIRSHRVPGGNTAIPFFTGNHGQLDLTKRFLQADRMRLSIKVPERRTAVRSEKPLAPENFATSEVPNYVYLGERLRFHVGVSNTGIGHNFPGGTIDINEAWLHVTVVDGQNALVYESGAIDGGGEVDREAYFYKSVPIDRRGEPVWRHDLFNMVGDSFKRIVPAGKSDTVPYEVEIPAWAKTPLTISATLDYRKFNIRYARWALDDPAIRLPVIDVARDAVSLPLRIREEAESGVSSSSTGIPDVTASRARRPLFSRVGLPGTVLQSSAAGEVRSHP